MFILLPENKKIFMAFFFSPAYSDQLTLYYVKFHFVKPYNCGDTCILRCQCEKKRYQIFCSVSDMTLEATNGKNWKLNKLHCTRKKIKMRGR